MSIATHICEIARSYSGLTEISPNRVWDDLHTPGVDARAERLRKSLLGAGHVGSNAYCMTFCKAVYREALPLASAQRRTINSLFTPSVVQTWKNCKQQGLVTADPQVGAVYFMQKGKSGLGHAGIVLEDNGRTMLVCDGNTSPMAKSAEADRSGDGVYEKVRSAIVTEPQSGLWLMGFFDLASLLC